MLERDELIEKQQATIRTLRAELERREQAEARSDQQAEIIRTIRDILARPNKDLDAGRKIVSIYLAIEVPYRAERPDQVVVVDGVARLPYVGPTGGVRLPNAALADGTGYSEDQASKLAKAVCSTKKRPNPAAPFEHHVRRVDVPGVDHPVSTVEYRPRVGSAVEALRAVAALPPDPDKAKHGGSTAASAARWQCRDHPQSAVIVTVTARCATCGKVCGTPEVRRLNLQDAGSGTGTTSGDSPVPIDLQDAGSADSGDPAPRRGAGSPGGERHPLGDVAIVATDELLDRLAREARAIPPGRDPDKWKRPGLLEPDPGHPDAEPPPEPPPPATADIVEEDF